MYKVLVSPKNKRVLYLMVLGTLILVCLAHLATWAQGACSSEGQKRCPNAVAPPAMDVYSWFAQYDAIRKHAKMSLKEKLQSRHLLVVIFVPMSYFSCDAQPFLQKMIDKYTEAIKQMEELPSLVETAELQEGYLKYFREARKLFEDICEMQKVSPEERRKIVPELMERKKELEKLDQANKQLDARLRLRHDIAPLK